MEFIFNHEKLRLDEIIKRISIRNHFTPLKPLTNSGSVSPKCKKNMTLKEIKNFSPLPHIVKRYEHDHSSSIPQSKSFNGKNAQSLCEKKKISDNKTRDYFKKDCYPKCKYLRKNYKFQNEKKNSLFVTYIPTPSYAND
jgi:hypothetical protein